MSDPGAEEALYDIQSMRAFAGLELGRDAIPDETTILNFRHLLERHELTKAIFAAVTEHLAAKGELLRGGTIVDATLIAASPSTKNREQKRDPEMSSSKKGNQWYFGMKAHVGVDAESGLVHTAGVTTGKVHDAKVMANLIREDDAAVYGDKGYASEEKKRAAEAAGVLWAVKEKAKPGRDLTRVADRLQIAGDDFVEWRSFRAGDLDDAVSRRRERHIGDDGRHVVRRDGLEQARCYPNDVSIRA